MFPGSRTHQQQQQEQPPRPDPRCLCMSDFSSVPQNAFHPQDSTFAIENLRSALQQRSSSGIGIELIKKEYVLFKANGVPKSKYSSVRQLRRDMSKDVDADGDGMIDDEEIIKGMGVSSSALDETKKFSSTTMEHQQTLWKSLKKSFPLVATTGADVSFLEAFCVSRFGDLSKISDVYQALCEKFEVRDPNLPKKISNTEGDNDEMKRLTSAYDDDNDNNNADAGGDLSSAVSMTMMHSPRGGGGMMGVPTATRSGTFYSPAMHQEHSSTYGINNVPGKREFTPKMKKKAPLSRVLKFLATRFECHIVLSLPGTQETNFEETTVHFAPSSFSALDRFKRNNNNNNNNNPMKDPRVVILRASGDMISRSNSTPNDEGFFIWNPYYSSSSSSSPSPSTSSYLLWQAAFLDNRIGAFNNKKKSSSSSKKGSSKKNRRQSSSSSSSNSSSASDSDDDSTSTTSSDDDDSSRSSTTSTSDSDDDDDDDDDTTSTSSITSSDNDDGAIQATFDAALPPGGGHDSVVSSSTGRNTSRDTAVILNHLQSPARFHEKIDNKTWTSSGNYKSKHVQTFFDRRGITHLDYNNNTGQPQSGDNGFGAQQPQQGNTQNNNNNNNRNLDIIRSDDVNDFVQQELPPLANIQYPSIDGSLGIGLLLKATLGSPSPLFKNMKMRLGAIIICCLLCIIFASAYLGTINPKFDTCCVEDQDPQVNGSFFVDGVTTAGVYSEYSKVFCPARKSLFEQKARNATAFGITTTTTTTSAAAGSTTTALAANDNSTISESIQCAQRICSAVGGDLSLINLTLRSAAIQAGKFGDSAGGPVEYASTFLFATIGPAVVIFVGCLLLIFIEVFNQIHVARRLAIKAHGIFAHVLHVFTILFALFILSEAAILVHKTNSYRSDDIEPMTEAVDCSILSDTVSRQLCLTASDCGVELRIILDGLSGATMMGLSAMMLIFSIILVIATILPALPSDEDQSKILPSNPHTLQFSPGKAAPDGMPMQKIVKLQHRISQKVFKIAQRDVEIAEDAQDELAKQRTYGNASQVFSKKKMIEEKKTPQVENKSGNNNNTVKKKDHHHHKNNKDKAPPKSSTTTSVRNLPSAASTNPNYKPNPVKVFSTTEAEKEELRKQGSLLPLPIEEIDRNNNNKTDDNNDLLSPELSAQIDAIANRVKSSGHSYAHHHQNSSGVAAVSIPSSPIANNNRMDVNNNTHQQQHSTTTVVDADEKLPEWMYRSNQEQQKMEDISKRLMKNSRSKKR